MKTFTTVRRTFHAGHTHEMCGNYPHGHDWFMAATAVPQGPVIGHAIVQLLFELELRDLNAMIVGADPTPEGIAAWALERLRPHIPGLRSVTVGFEGYEATVEV